MSGGWKVPKRVTYEKKASFLGKEVTEQCRSRSETGHGRSRTLKIVTVARTKVACSVCTCVHVGPGGRTRTL